MDYAFAEGGLVLVNTLIGSLCSYFLIATYLMLSGQSCRSTQPVRSANATQKVEPQKVEPQKVEPPKGEVASYKVQIDFREGKCVLKYDGPFHDQIETALGAPCDFVRNRTGAIQHFEYKNSKRNGGGSYSAILLVGGPIDTSRSYSFMKNGCGTKVQAVSFSPRGVAIGAIGTGLLVCPSTELDEKMFGSIAKPI
jgi:hypothetical protein